MNRGFPTKGWSKMSDQKIKQFFRTPADTIRKIKMTTSITTLHQYEENMIILRTMKDMKKILYGPQNKFHKFKIRCFLKNYEARDKSIRKRHPVLFRDKQNHVYTNDQRSESISLNLE